jgi:glucokinase
MVKKAKARRKKGVASRLLEYHDEEITPRLIEDLAEAGDRQCTEILQEAGRYLGVGLASVVNLLNLERVVIGGGISAAGPVLFDPIETHFRLNVLPQAGRRCELVKAALGNDAGIMGGAATVFMSREELSR